MKFVFQKNIAGSEQPDCMTACFASIFDLELNQVPNFCPKKEDSQYYNIQHRLMDNYAHSYFGKRALYLSPDFYPQNEYYILVWGFKGVMNPHSVVMINNNIVHCPSYGWFKENGPIDFDEWKKENPLSYKISNIVFRQSI